MHYRRATGHKPAYYSDDTIRSLAQASGGTTTTQTFYLDALGRTACYHHQTSGTAPAGCGTTPGDEANHYSGDSDSPAWTVTTPTSGVASTYWYGTGLDGNLAVDVASTGSASTVTYQLVGLHGDVWLTTSQAATASPDGTAIYSDEYGNTGTGAQPYAWLGGKQRATEGLAQLITMGARIYAPNLGRFTSTDPIYGGNDNTYTYPPDPINTFDLNGQFGWSSIGHFFKKAVHWASHHKLDIALTVATFLPVAGEFAAAYRIVRVAELTEGMAGGIRATRATSWLAGRMWVGLGSRATAVGRISADGLRQYRNPAFKEALGIIQSNFESRSVSQGRWINNYHIGIRRL